MIRLVRFERQNSASGATATWGVATAEGIIDLGPGQRNLAPNIVAAIQDWPQLKPLVQREIESSRETSSSFVPEPTRLLSPIPEGGKLLCIGLNYRDHAIESGMEIPTEPIVFNKLAGALCGPGDVVPLPACSQKVDYEAELVAVIGRRAWQVGEADADQHIFGYACGHDVSARDWQLGRPGGQWLLGKSFPRFAPVGPYLVPSEFIADPCKLSITLKINGQTFQASNTDQLIFSPRQLVSFLSQCCVLEPGDIIFTGTPPGVGAARKPPRFLASGDICEVEVDGLGVLTNSFA